MVYNPTNILLLKSIKLQHILIISYMKLVIESMGDDKLEHFWEERNRWVCLATRACGLAEVYF